jgi:hypothetical protein
MRVLLRPLGGKQMNEVVAARIQTGTPVRIDGKECPAGPVISGGRVLTTRRPASRPARHLDGLHL